MRGGTLIYSIIDNEVFIFKVSRKVPINRLTPYLRHDTCIKNVCGRGAHYSAIPPFERGKNLMYAKTNDCLKFSGGEKKLEVEKTHQRRRLVSHFS